MATKRKSTKQKKKAAPRKKASRARPPAKKPSAERRAPERSDPAESRDKTAAIRIAAFHCFSERGYHDTRVDDICQEAGISKGSFYWYFESKEAVFLQILEVWVAEVENEIMAQFQAAFTGGDPVHALLAALGREGRRGRRLLPVWLDGLVQSQRNERLREAMAVFMARVRKSLADVIRPAFAPYHAPEQVDALAGLLFSCFIGSISQHLAEPEAGHYEHQVRTLLETTDRFATLLVDHEQPRTP